MLFYKVWLETRLRFYIALIILTGVGVLYVCLHPILIPQWIVALNDPGAIKPTWLYKGIYDIRFYLWHFLFDYHFQEIWVLFALIISIGGLNLESNTGTILFSLGFPVKRSEWIRSKFLVSCIEVIIIAILSSVLIALFARFFDLHYSMVQALAHSLLLAISGCVFIGIGILISTLLRTGYYLTVVILLIGIGLPYLFIQEFVREANPNSWLYYIDISHIMAGPWLLHWSNFPWIGIFISVIVTSFLVAISTRISKNHNY